MAILTLTSAHLESIRAHLASSPHAEICGLIGGDWHPYPQQAIAYEVWPIPNIAPHPSARYRMEPQAQLHAMLHFYKQGWQVVAIYHSHPTGSLSPSSSDIAEWVYPDALCMIGLPTGEIGLWHIIGSQAHPAEMQLTTP